MIDMKNLGEFMKQLILTITFLLTFALVGLTQAQQSATVVGVITPAEALTTNVRMGVHLIDEGASRLVELTKITPIGGTFNITAGPISPSYLQPFLDGVTVFPGILNEYTVSPQGAKYARAITNIYTDNGNEQFDDPVSDPLFLGIASVENPQGFFVLMYVDQDLQIIAKDVTLQLRNGWNIMTMRFDEGQNASYAVQSQISDAVLELFVPVDETATDAPAEAPAETAPASEGQ